MPERKILAKWVTSHSKSPTGSFFFSRADVSEFFFSRVAADFMFLRNKRLCLLALSEVAGANWCPCKDWGYFTATSSQPFIFNCNTKSPPRSALQCKLLRKSSCHCVLALVTLKCSHLPTLASKGSLLQQRSHTYQVVQHVFGSGRREGG